jgi:hypothetical protein
VGRKPRDRRLGLARVHPDGRYHSTIALGALGASVDATWQVVEETDKTLTVRMTGQLRPNGPVETRDYRIKFLDEVAISIEGGGNRPRQFRRREQGRPVTPDKPVVLVRSAADLVVGLWEATAAGPGQAGKVQVEFRHGGTVAGRHPEGPANTPTAVRGTWKVTRSESNNLWVRLELRRVLDDQPAALGNSEVLLRFLGDDSFEAALLVSSRITFRRGSGNLAGVPAEAKPTRPLKEWVRGTWESDGSPAQGPGGRSYPASTLEFRPDGTYVATTRKPGEAPTNTTGTWEALNQFDRTLVVVIRVPGKGTAPGTAFQMRLLFVGENELRFLLGDPNITPPTFRRK